MYPNPQANTLQLVVVGTVSTFNSLEPPSSTCTTSFTLSVGKILVFLGTLDALGSSYRTVIEGSHIPLSPRMGRAAYPATRAVRC